MGKQIVIRRIVTALSVFVLVVSSAIFAGCDGGKSGKIEEAPEAKKGDEIGKKAMEDFMKGGGPAKDSKKKLY
jgi:hypothetical protein